MVPDTVGECGQVTLPREFLEAAGIEPGDFVLFHVTGPNTIQLSLYHRLTVEEMFEKYRIEGPVDLKAELEAMYEELADDYLRKIERNVADAERRAGVAGGLERDRP